MKKGSGTHRDMRDMGNRMLDKLQKASGEAFDQEFVRSMISHHNMAIQMSRPPTRFTSPELQAFARRLVEKQSKEIQELDAMTSKK